MPTFADMRVCPYKPAKVVIALSINRGSRQSAHMSSLFTCTKYVMDENEDSGQHLNM